MQNIDSTKIQDCPICLCEMKASDKTTGHFITRSDGSKIYGHKLHEKCADQWAKHSSKCPTCREEMYPKLFNFNFTEISDDTKLAIHGAAIFAFIAYTLSFM
jgi:hypothetical protein